MEQRVLYEAGFVFHGAWLILLTLLIASISMTVRYIKLLIAPQKYGKKGAKVGAVIGVLGTLILLAALGLVIPYQIEMYRSTVAAYRNGDYQIAEGYVEQFQPAKERGNPESFTIDGVDFRYYDTVVQFGYHTTRARGGVITGDGQHLRIGYTQFRSLKNVIVYIEELP